MDTTIRTVGRVQPGGGVALPSRGRFGWRRLCLLVLALVAAWATRWWWAPAVARWDALHQVRVEKDGTAVYRLPFAPVARALGDAALPGLRSAWIGSQTRAQHEVVLRTLSLIGTPAARDVTFDLLEYARASGRPQLDLVRLVVTLCQFHGSTATVLHHYIASDPEWPDAARRGAVNCLISDSPPELKRWLRGLIAADARGALESPIILRLSVRKTHDLDSLLELYLRSPDVRVRSEAAEALRNRRRTDGSGRSGTSGPSGVALRARP